MALSEPSIKESSSGYAVPLGWVAFIAGLLGIAGSILIRFGVLPKTDYPVGVLGIALFVGGYIACFIIPPLLRRVSALEQRVNNLEDNRM
ncbi:MAG: hypothetical protein HYV60_03805 [Planctomycetia bacterium]|nr:hypothetical protein [Planctomycetia bacterium]